MREAPDALVERCVVPFYLDMMRLNARGAGGGLLPRIAALADGTTPQEVAQLLGSPWRPRVMGAWLAVRYSGATVQNALLASIRTCQGDLTAAPLATAACLVGGDAAVPALAAYLDVDVAQHLGAGGFVAAAIERLGGVPRHVDPSQEDRESLGQMLTVGRALKQW